MCAILFKITSRPPLLNPLQPKSKVLQVSLSTILAMQFQELYPQCCHSDEELRAMLDYMLDLEETTRQVGFVNVCSILTDPRQRTDTATVPY